MYYLYRYSHPMVEKTPRDLASGGLRTGMPEFSVGWLSSGCNNSGFKEVSLIWDSPLNIIESKKVDLGENKNEQTIIV